MKKIITLVLALLMLVSSFTFTVSAEEPFEDVKDSHWYFRAVEYCFENGLMSGMSETTFAPTGKVTREQFVKTLANMEGINEADYKVEESPFKDVKLGQWYAPAVEWARQTGIVAGLSADTFGIGKPVTREQIARLLRGYAEYKGKEIKETSDLSAFPDADKISDWALDGFKYAIANGIFKGNAKNEINPRGGATRAELATILKAVRAYENNKLVAWGDSFTQGIIEGFHDISDYPYIR
ncbi:MAG: S-layer homology domain-containing protein, partial [Clostridia bacterium]|nr:S-layer homology domain-containing protein [Clostridia bacterium]